MTLGAVIGVLALLTPTAALAGKGNPGGTGPPSQSCQEIEKAGGHTPGKAANSPGSPFNEPEINSRTGRHRRPALQRELAVRRGLLPRLLALT